MLGFFLLLFKKERFQLDAIQATNIVFLVQFLISILWEILEGHYVIFLKKMLGLWGMMVIFLFMRKKVASTMQFKALGLFFMWFVYYDCNAYHGIMLVFMRSDDCFVVSGFGLRGCWDLLCESFWWWFVKHFFSFFKVKVILNVLAEF